MRKVITSALAVVIPLGTAAAQCDTEQIAELLASDAGNRNSYFGKRMSVVGDTLIVGAEADDIGGVESAGSAYIFRNQGDNNWVEMSKVSASDGAAFDSFGRSVATDGNLAVVGAFHAWVYGLRSGAAYVFREDGNGNWYEAAKLVPDHGAEDDNFGNAVAVAANEAIVAAPGYNGGFGALFAFVEDGNGSWSLRQTIVPSDPQPDHYFGHRLASANDVLVVGVPSDNDNGSDSGAVYIFERDTDTGQWIETDQITPSDAAAVDGFGKSVAFDGVTIAVGSPLKDDYRGAVYFFRRDGEGNWTEVKKYTWHINSELGQDVAVSGPNALLIGAGATWIVREVGENWISQGRLVPDEGGYPNSIALLGDIAFGGQSNHRHYEKPDGAVHVFDLNCSPIATLTGISIESGVLLDGDLPDLFSSDGLYVHARSGFGETLVDLHNMEARISAVATQLSPESLDLAIESRIDERSGIAQFSLLNHNTGRYDLMGQFGIGSADAIETIEDIGATDYVDGAGNIELSIKHIVFVPFLAFTFESWLDWVEIAVR